MAPVDLERSGETRQPRKPARHLSPTMWDQRLFRVDGVNDKTCPFTLPGNDASKVACSHVNVASSDDPELQRVAVQPVGLGGSS